MMKYSKLRRILLLLACAVLLVSLSVGATLAYLTSTTETVKNTFTVGNVVITLDETNTDGVDQESKANPGVARDNGNKYNLVPGMSYTKDPTVTVLANSEACYVRVKVTVDVSTSWPVPADSTTDTFATWAANFASDYLLNDHTEDYKGFNTESWTADAGTIDATARTITYILTYKNSEGTSIVAKKASDTVLPAIFDDFCVPATVGNAELAKLEGMKINVVAEAIQSDSFANADAAWDAFDLQEANK